jgi:hypothetical protein
VNARRFVPYHELGDTPNVIVDGGPTASTVLTLSHWPGSPTPPDLLEDTSAAIAFRALDEPAVLGDISAVSNNHFDQDGLMSAFALIEPEQALPRRDLLIDVATAGDFATFTSRTAMRLAFAIAALADARRSSLPASTFDRDYSLECAALYRAVLPRVGELVDDPGSVRSLWEAEDAHLDRSLRAIDAGTITIEEDAALDLAIVHVPGDWAVQPTTRFANARTDVVHPAAVNQSTSRLRILVVHGRRYRVELRYETWVMFRSRPTLLRPDLRILATELDALEPGSTRWAADSPGAITPVLSSSDDSGLSPDAFRAHLQTFLATAPVAWDPYARN